MDKIINNRKFRFLLACISLLVLIDLVQDTYAKYVTSADATGTFTIARWAFSINTQDVVANNDFTATLSPTFDANANIDSNVIAPTSTGSFQIVIDSSDVDVAFNEVITVAQSEDNTVTDLIFTGYKKNNDPVVSINSDTATITNAHTVGELNTTNTYIFYIEWKDGTGEDMDNADDTQATIDGVAEVTVNVSFTQVASQSASPSSSSSSASQGD